MQKEEAECALKFILVILPSRRSTSFCNLAIVRSARSARCSAYTHMIDKYIYMYICSDIYLYLIISDDEFYSH